MCSATQKERRAIEALRQLSWTSGIVKAASANASPGQRFELRFAYELHRAGIEPVRPFRAGVDNTDIDFRIPGAVPWNIELLSVAESEAVRGARVRYESGPVRVEQVDLGLVGHNEEDQRRVEAKQTPESELLRLISKLGEKAWEDSRPVKFPLAGHSEVNMILVDVRSYGGGQGLVDEFDCRQALFGPRGLPDHLIMWDHGSGKPIRGLWDLSNTQQRALAFRERVQVVGFVHEEAFADDEIRQVALLFQNPAFSIELANNPLGWPARTAPRTGLRRENTLWNPG
jgi:hypothetical protein